MKKKMMCLLTVVLVLVGLAVGEKTVAPVPPEKTTITISLAGDIMLSRGLTEYLEKEGFAYPYSEVRDLFLSDDLTIANLECPITDAGNPANKEKRFLFQADAENAVALKENGFDCLDLANNHTLDYLALGLSDTLDALENEGIGTVGAGKNADADTTYLFEKDGFTIGILAYSALPPEGLTYSAQKACINYISHLNQEKVAKEIAALSCDYKIVYFHWGEEYNPYHSKTQEAYAHMAIDNGADLVVGAHPHVLQEKEIYQGKPIYYSLGNFVFDRQIQKGTDKTMILQVKLTPDQNSGNQKKHASGQKQELQAEYTEIPAEIEKGKVVRKN